jgi:hypothetical protein
VPRTARGGMVRLRYRAPVRDKVPRTARGGMVRLRYRAPVNLKHKNIYNNTPVEQTTPCQGVECSFEHSVMAKSTTIIVVDSHLNLRFILAVFKVDFMLENRDFNQLHFRFKQIECFLQFGIATGCPCWL